MGLKREGKETVLKGWGEGGAWTNRLLACSTHGVIDRTSQN